MYFLIKCQKILKRDIPIICIEGNHENPFFSDHTWLKLLTDLDLIVLLSAEYDPKNNTLLFDSKGKYSINNLNIYGVS